MCKTRMKFWEDACTDEKKAHFTHTFALFLTVLATLQAVVALYDWAVDPKDANGLAMVLGAAGAYLMYLQYKNCREWYEIVLWNILLSMGASAVGAHPVTRRVPRTLAAATSPVTSPAASQGS